MIALPLVALLVIFTNLGRVRALLVTARWEARRRNAPAASN